MSTRELPTIAPELYRHMPETRRAIALGHTQGPALPALIAGSGEKARVRFLEFFAAQIRNPNTREAYARAVGQFLAWCQGQGARELGEITPMAVAAYIEGHPGSPATVKQHLAALRRLFDWLVIGHVIETNPAASVRGPSVSYTRGKTPVLQPDEARQLFEHIPTDTPVGLRDRALLGVLLYSFARISAALGMKVEDYYGAGKRWRLRLHEKGGKYHDLPAHHLVEEYLDSYLDAAGFREESKSPLFRTVRGRSGELTARPFTRNDALQMIRRRAKAAGLSDKITPHSLRATGITVYCANGGRIEKAKELAAHASVKTTQLYDRSSDPIILDEIERIAL